MSDLAAIPDGWTPRSWQQRLTCLGRCCINEPRGAELCAAADAIENEFGPPRVCFDCKLELGGPAVGRPFDPGEIRDVEDHDRLLCRPCAWRRERANAPERKKYFLRLMRAAS